MEKLFALITSRKFWAALIGLVLLVLKSYKPDFPIGEAELTNMVYILVAYILGVAIDDAGILRGIPVIGTANNKK
jgi:hypoxanthine-guanine phosphoribosyltransferase